MSQPASSVLSNFWSPLCAVGSHGANGPNAQICVSVFGASIVPERPRILVVLSNTNYTTSLVKECGTLSVTVLSQVHLPLLSKLGLHSGRDSRKLDGLEYTPTAQRDPVFPGGAGWLAAEVLSATSFGDSTGFLAAVRERSDGPAAPLSWQAARGVLSEDFLRAWAEKSAREQAAARETMLWQG